MTDLSWAELSAFVTVGLLTTLWSVRLFILAARELRERKHDDTR